MSADIMTDQRRRPRRSSFTKHVQRLLRLENQVDKRQGDPNPASTSHQEFDITAQNGSEKEDIKDSPHGSHSAVDPKEPVELATNKTVARVDLAYPGSQQSRDLSVKNTNNRPETRVSPSSDNSAVKSKEKRVTKRLEAERKDLENRLRQLEEAESNLGPRKRISRRLTKKQPLVNSNRESSVGADPSRSSRATFASFFSGSRRSSRSRSSSANGSEHASSRPQSAHFSNKTHADNGSSTTIPSLNLNLPERFGSAISRELEHQNTAIFPDYKSSGQPQRSLNATTRSPDTRLNTETSQAKKQNGYSHRDYEAISQQSAGPSQGNQANTKDGAQKQSSTATTSNSQADLDRLSFAATLNLHKRAKSTASSTAGALSSLSPAKATTQSKGYEQSHAIKQLKASIMSKSQTPSPIRQISSEDNGPNAIRSRATSSPSSLQEFSIRTASIKSSSDKSSRSYNAIFKSSPLAAAPTTSSSMDVSSKTRSTTIISTARKTKNETQVRPVGLTASENFLASKSETTQTVLSLGHYRKEETRVLGNLSNPALITSPSSGNTSHKVNGSPQIPDRHHLRAKDNQRQIPPSISSSVPTADSPAKPAHSHTIIPWKDVTAAASLSRNNGPLNGVSDSLHGHQSKQIVPKGDWAKLICSRDTTSNASLKLPGPVSNSGSRQLLGLSTHLTTLNQLMDVPERPSSECSSQEPPPEEDYETAQEGASSAAGSRETLPITRYPGKNSPAHLRRPFDCKDSVPSSSKIPASATACAANLQPTKPVRNVKPLQQGQLLTKAFVICCHCNFWHDMPSEVYSKFASADNLPGKSEPNPYGKRDESGSHEEPLKLQGTSSRNAQSPRCCWCEHQFNRLCCQRWTTTVQLRERDH